MNAITQTTIRYQIFEYSPTLKEWLYATTPTENETEARGDLKEMTGLYPQAKFRLVKIENIVTVMEGATE